jgi:hypothetical protein
VAVIYGIIDQDSGGFLDRLGIQETVQPGPVIHGRLDTAALAVYGPGKLGHMSAYLLSVLFGNLCCNTVYYYRHAGLGFRNRARFFLPYTLSRPVSWVIQRNGLKRIRRAKPPSD